MIKSVYADSHNVTIKKEIKYKKFGYILRDEIINNGGDDVLLKVCYDFNGLYLGCNKTASRLCRRYKLSKFEPAGSGNIASIGFSEAEQKWYGWSHRAIYGFGIGSTVKRGDCAYNPINKGDMLIDLLNFWDVGKVNSLGKGKTCINELVSVYLDDEHREEYYKCSKPEDNCETKGCEPVSLDDVEYGEPEIGIKIVVKTSFNYDREPYTSEYFEPYPSKWGHGEWTAKTMKDAKQIARDFASSVA